MEIFENGSAADDKIQLIIFHHAGGSSLAYRALEKFFPKNIKVKYIDLPGRIIFSSQKPYKNMQELIKRLSIKLSQEIQGKYVMFGHSMGAIVAFELARNLTKFYNMNPQHLLVSGCCAPSRYSNSKPIINSFLSDEELTQILIDTESVQPEVLQNEEFKALTLFLIRADFKVLESYCYESQSLLKCPITAFSAADDPWAPREYMEYWRFETEGEFDLIPFEGKHFSILNSKKSLAQKIVKKIYHYPV